MAKLNNKRLTSKTPLIDPYGVINRKRGRVTCKSPVLVVGGVLLFTSLKDLL